jgi:hypothetical protein
MLMLLPLCLIQLHSAWRASSTVRASQCTVPSQMALAVPHLALRGCRRICARASRARVTPKALLPGRSSPDREREATVHSGGVVAATLASLLLVRPSVLLSCRRPGCCHAQRSEMRSPCCWDCGNGAWIKCFSRAPTRAASPSAPALAPLCKQPCKQPSVPMGCALRHQSRCWSL